MCEVTPNSQTSKTHDGNFYNEIQIQTVPKISILAEIWKSKHFKEKISPTPNKEECFISKPMRFMERIPSQIPPIFERT